MEHRSTFDLSDADVAAWRELMAELAAAGVGEPNLAIAGDDSPLIRLSAVDEDLMPLGISRLVGDGVRPLAAEEVAEALNRRGWIEPAGVAGTLFRITAGGRGA